MGFRDQLQDCMALLYSMPQKAREIIIKAGSRQFIEGDVMHWWNEDTGTGIRTKISDDMLWLPYVLSGYVMITGDESVLDEKTSYLIWDKLKTDEYEKYGLPEISDQSGSIYEHAKKAILHSMKFGKHGLPLMGSGDWNDGMNRIGHRGQGESVWLGWFEYTVMDQFKTIARIKGDDAFIREMAATQKQLKASINETAWDGQWYLRAFFDDGNKVGSKEQVECKIDLISQAWSAISKAGDEKKVKASMESVKKYLLDENEKMMMVLTPPFHRSRPNPGYIQGYLRGVRENGGQYTHAAIWGIYAYAVLDDRDTAYRLFGMLNPISHGENPSDVLKYMTEPYAVAADIYYNNLQKGRGGWSFYTGSAAWLYRAGIELLLGFKKTGNRLCIDPSLPDGINNYSIEYDYGKTKYVIHIERNIDQKSTRYIIDGKDQKDKFIELDDDGHDKIIKVILPM
jgi:cellobiose phosphorylase